MVSRTLAKSIIVMGSQMKKEHSDTTKVLGKLIPQEAIEKWEPATLLDVDFTPFPPPVSQSFSVDGEYDQDTPMPYTAIPFREGEKATSLDTPRSMPGRHQTVLPEVERKGEEVILTPSQRERYHSLAQLGEGGAGEVVLVQDNDIHRKVAMKRVKSELQDNVHLARFVEEIKTIGQLEHPNITPIHDVGLDETGQHYFTMKYVKGDTLEDIIQKLREGDPEYHKRYSYERRTQVFIEILQAVRFAHDKGIIHRDIKPANVMVGAYGEVMVMDWGIAKQMVRQEIETPNTPPDTPEWAAEELEGAEYTRAFETAVGSLVGTPAYMSPEQALGCNQELDQRSDIYSLCMLFYELLNLYHPLEHKADLKQVLWGVYDEDPPDSESLSNPHQGPVPRELCFFLRKGLKKDPEQRFQHIDEMIDELQANTEGRICVYCPSTFLKRGAHGYGRYLDNHRVLGVVLFVLLLGILGMGFWHTFQTVLAAL